jgi:hypothetical protein
MLLQEDCNVGFEPTMYGDSVDPGGVLAGSRCLCLLHK